MAEFEFTERAPHEAGFRRFFHNRVVPVLKEIERSRGEARRELRKDKGRVRKAAFLALFGGIAIDIFLASLGWGGGFFLVGLAVFALLMFTGTKKVAKIHGDRMSAPIIPLLCEFLGDMAPAEADFHKAGFAALGIAGGADSLETENGIDGHHRGIEFRMCEVWLKTGDKRHFSRHRNQDFHGIALEIQLLNPGPRIAFVRKIGGVVARLSEKSWQAGDQTLDLADDLDPRLAEHFKLFTNDLEAARDYLIPQVVDGLVQIAEEQKARHVGIQAQVEGIFYDDWLCLKIPITRDFLQIGNMKTPMSEIEEDLHRALGDLTLPHRIIDRLTKS